jgi:hypothetical protein
VARARFRPASVQDYVHVYDQIHSDIISIRRSRKKAHRSGGVAPCRSMTHTLGGSTTTIPGQKAANRVK